MSPTSFVIKALGVLLIGIFVSCNRGSVDFGPVPDRTSAEILRAIKKHNVDYEWFHAKGGIDFNSKMESGSASYDVRIKRDSIIWLQLKKLSIEVARMQMTPDSLFIVYRWDKMYEADAVHKFSESYGLDLSFDKLQDFFIGNSPLPDTSNVHIVKRENQYIATNEDNNYTYTHWVDAYTLRLDGFKMMDRGDRFIQVLFDKYKRTEDKKDYSHFRFYSAPMQEDVDSYAKIDISKVYFDVEKKIKFSIPKHYKKLP